jgi:hypothetical protein
LEQFEPYAESIWHEAVAPVDSGFFGDGRSEGNGGIRGTGGVALVYSTLARYGPARERPRRIDRVSRALRYIAATHVTGSQRCIDGQQWGHGWQSGLWAATAGLAAALIEDELPPDVLAGCRRMVASEADRLAGIPPASGYIGNSRAEENAWNSNVLALAAAWLHEDARSQGWSEAARRYLVNTYTIVDSEDDPLRAWVSTTTMHPSFTIENHGVFHPSYQAVAGMSLGDSLLMARMTNEVVAVDLRGFAEHNVLRAWASLSQVLLDSGDFAYPSGLDWALHGYGQVSYYAWLARHFGHPVAAWAEEKLAGLIVDRQRCAGHGRFFGESLPDGFFREAVLARRLAVAYLHHRTASGDPPRGRAPEPVVTHWPDVKLILQRSPRGFVSVSYGARTVAIVVPTSRAFEDRPHIVTPRVPSLLSRGPEPHDRPARLLEFERTDVGFRAVLDIPAADEGSTVAHVQSTGDALAILEIPRNQRDEVGLGSGFPIGIENHELTGGSRRLVGVRGVVEVAAITGRVVSDLGRWANVDDRLGVIVGPDGTLEYRVAEGYNRPGAAEDTLRAVGLDLTRPRFAVFLPAATSQQTAEVLGKIQFAFGDDDVSLVVVSPSHHRITLGTHTPAITAPHSRN